MPPTILSGGSVRDRNDAGAQQVQAHAQRLGLDRVQMFPARLIGKEPTYLVMQWPRPVFQQLSADAVTM